MLTTTSLFMLTTGPEEKIKIRMLLNSSSSSDCVERSQLLSLELDAILISIRKLTTSNGIRGT